MSTKVFLKNLILSTLFFLASGCVPFELDPAQNVETQYFVANTCNGQYFFTQTEPVCTADFCKIKGPAISVNEPLFYLLGPMPSSLSFVKNEKVKTQCITRVGERQVRFTSQSGGCANPEKICQAVTQDVIDSFLSMSK